MAGSPAIEVRSAAARQQVDGARRRVTDNAAAFRVIGMRLKASMLRNFRVGGFYPEKWKPTHRGGQILVDNNHLKGGIHSRSRKNFAVAGTTALVYAAIHQYGGRCGENHSVDMPARPYLPIKDGQLHSTDQEFIDRALTSWVVEGRA